jgi:hypothetical protein
MRKTMDMTDIAADDRGPLVVFLCDRFVTAGNANVKSAPPACDGIRMKSPSRAGFLIEHDLSENRFTLFRIMH